MGDSPESKRFIDMLSNDPEVGDMIFCNDETLDAAVREAWSNGGALYTWVC